MRGVNKAFLAENYIGILKRRLFMALRVNLSDNWVKILQPVTNLLNNSYSKALLYFFTPAEVNAPEFDSVIRYIKSLKSELEAQKEEEEVSAKRRKTEKNVFEVNDYVYYDVPRKPFDKSFDIQRGTIFQVASVDKRQHPYMYKLKELDGKLMKGTGSTVVHYIECWIVKYICQFS